MSIDDLDADTPADRALRQMARGIVPLEDSGRVAARRERLLPGLSAFTGAVVDARRRRRWWTACVAAAAVVALAGGALFRELHFGERPSPAVASVRAKQGEVRLSRAGAPPGPIGAGTVELLARDRVETADSSAEVNLGSGALVEVDARTALELGPDLTDGPNKEEHLELALGRIGVKVPKLPAGSKLTVGTPSAKVTVHGTAFEVDVRRIEGGATSTRVSVTEGRVSVESEGREIMLGPGANWSSSVVAPPAPAEVSSPERDEATAPAHSAGAPVPRSTLARENALFQSAMAARHAGDPLRAVEILDRLLAKYPETPLAVAVKAERERALAEIEQSRGSGNSGK